MNSLELARDHEALAARLGSIFLESRVAIAPFFEDASTKEALERSRTSYKVKRYSLQHIIQSVQENETYNNQRKKTYKRVTLFTTLFFFLSCGLPIRVATIRHLSPRFSYQRSIFPRKKRTRSQKTILTKDHRYLFLLFLFCSFDPTKFPIGPVHYVSFPMARRQFHMPPRG